MGSSLKVAQLDNILHNLKSDPVYINSIDTTNLEGKRTENNFLYARYTDGIIDVSISCECGMTKSNKNHGKRCPHCNTIVQSRVDRILENRLWYPRPDQIVKLFNPIAWIMLGTNLSLGSFNIVAYFCDRSRTLDAKESTASRYLAELPFERGFNNFVNNHEEIIESLAVPKIMTAKSRRNAFLAWYEMYKDDLFVDHIPLPNREFIVMEQTGSARFAQATNTSAIDAIRTLTSMKNIIYTMTEERIEKKLVKFYEQITDYYNVTLAKFIGTKKGIFRKHIYGDILAWTCRCVLTSITGPHRHDDIELPWVVALRLFRYHLFGRLRYKYNMSPNEICDVLDRAVNYLDPRIIEIFEYMFATGYMQCSHVILGRNPTIYKGNILKLNCRRIKYDLHDYTIGVSILVVKSMNGDFDGDEGNITLSIDNKASANIARFGPHTIVMEESACWEVSRNIAMPPPSIPNINNYLNARGKPIA